MFDNFHLSAIVHSTLCRLLGLEYSDSLMTAGRDSEIKTHNQDGGGHSS